MEFRLNKIDPEVRERVKETTSPGKVHNKAGITINKDSKDNKNKDNRDFCSELEKKKNKNNEKNFYVDAVKVEKVEISAYKEEIGMLPKSEIKGNILDVKK